MTQRNFPKYLLIPLILFVILYSIFLGKEKIEEKKYAALLNWTSYEKAISEADESGKAILIDFHSDLCMPCKKMDKTTYRDSLVVALLEKEFVLVRVNPSNWFNPTVSIKKGISAEDSLPDQWQEDMRLDGEDLAELYHISTIPTTVILDSKGKEIGRLEGYRGPKEFIEELQSILKQKESAPGGQSKEDSHIP